MTDRGYSLAFARVLWTTFFLAAACGGSHQGAHDPNAKSAGSPESAAPTSAPSASPTEPRTPSTGSTSSLDALPPPDTDTGAQSRRSLTLTESRGTVDTSTNTIPSPPAKIEAPPQAGVDAAIKAVPSTVPVGTLSKNVLEAPLQDRARFEHCAIPYGTHGEIAAVVYNGSALGVDVKTKPNDRALNFCIEHTVRQMTWIKELAVNKVKVSF
jgi:hypothetical protein